VIRNRTERIAGYILYLISGGYQSLKEGDQRDRILISVLLIPPSSVSAEDLQCNIHPAKGTSAPMLPARIDELITGLWADKEGLWKKKNSGLGITEDQAKIEEYSMILTTKALNEEVEKIGGLGETADLLEILYDPAEILP
jgi:hypothetical protein